MWALKRYLGCSHHLAHIKKRNRKVRNLLGQVMASQPRARKRKRTIIV